MRKLLIVLAIYSFQINAQVNMDSLWGIWNDQSNSDSLRLNAIGKMAFYMVFENPDSSYQLAQLELDKALEVGDKERQADAINTQGASFYLTGKYDKAIDYFDRSLELYKEIDDYENVGNLLNNISGVYVSLKSYDEALTYLYEGEIYFKQTHYGLGLGLTYVNLGTVLVYKSELNISLEKKMEYLDSAYYFLHKALSKSKEVKSDYTRTNSLGNLGLVHYYLDDMDSATFYLERALELSRSINYQDGTAEYLVTLSNVKRKIGDFSSSINLAKEALEIADGIGLSAPKKNASLSLYKTYKAKGKYKNALEMYETYIATRDSLEKEENQKATIRQQFKYEYAKQAAADSVAHAKELEIADIQIEKQEADLRAKRNQQYALFSGLLLIAVFAFIMYNRFKITRKQKVIIEDAHSELEEKNKEIMDSISYAKRIQTAILPPPKLIDEHLSNSFILYKPKDIVAGDFYWFEKTENGIMIAAADCTGHGVPGAMVSVICNNGLNRAVNEFNLNDPGEILNKTRDIVIREFEKSEEEVKDGMDIALVSLAVSSKSLESGELNTQSSLSNLKYSGANNPLWIIRKGTNEVEEIKATKQPIGKFDNPIPFKTHEVELNQGDTIYIFSDGYVDQFGGPKGKKFKGVNFKKLLLSIQNEPIQKQRDLIDKAFEDWKGNTEQVDDVCVIGIRI